MERQKLSESNSALPLPNKTYTVKQIKRQIESTSVSCRSSGTSGYDTESGADTEIDLVHISYFLLLFDRLNKFIKRILFNLKKNSKFNQKLKH